MSELPDPSSLSNPTKHLTTRLKFDWKIDFEQRKIIGTTILIVKQLTPDKGSELLLDTLELTIHSVHVDNQPVEWKLVPSPHTFYGACLQIPTNHSANETFEVKVSYETSPQSTALQWLDANLTADRRQPFMFSQCQAIHARALTPCQDTPSVKCPFEAKVKVEFDKRIKNADIKCRFLGIDIGGKPVEHRIRLRGLDYLGHVQAPNGVVVIMGASKRSNPTPCSQNPTWNSFEFEQPVPIPSYLLTICSGHLACERLGQRSSVWAEPSLVKKAAEEFKETEQMLIVAEELCGPYIWGIYDILVLPPPFPYGGMENPCLTFVSPTIIAGDRSLVNVVAHEIAHSWSGNLVTNSTWEHFWLNEGHTVYLERLIMERLHGSDMRQLLMSLGYEELLHEVKTWGASSPFTKLVPKLGGFNPDGAYNRIPYEKGSLFLYSLELRFGKEKMLSWLKSYFVNFSGKSLDTPTWLEFFCKQMGIKELPNDVNLDEWFNAPGLPSWKPSFQADVLLNQCDHLSELFNRSDLCSNSVVCDELVKLWKQVDNVQQQLVIRRVAEKANITPDNMATLDRILGFSSQNNAELRMEWSRLCARLHYLPALESCFEFLNSQGRMKYTRPLYKALYDWEEIKERVKINFETQRPFMHPVTAMLVYRDLFGPKPQTAS